MPGQRIGSTIAATFGLLYVLLNTGALPAPVAWSLRVLGAIAFAAVLVAVWRGRAAPTDGPPAAGGVNPFGRSYWLVVGVEVVALFGGLRLLSGPLDQPDASVAWVSFVVGAHFFALAVVFHAPFFHWLGAAVTLCGVVGLILAFAGAGSAWIAVIAGVIPGALLLAFGWWGATSTHTADQKLAMG